LAVLLNVHYRLPYKKIQGLFSDLFGYPINESTINQAGKKCYANLEESEQIIKSKIVGQKVAHADETGIRIAGKLQWLHTATSLLYTYLFVHEKRGTGAIQSKKDAVLAFAFNPEVPFTNNLAERDIRPAKVKQKISNCFRTFQGAEIYARIEGFISTARKNRRNVFSELCTTFDGNNFITG